MLKNLILIAFCLLCLTTCSKSKLPRLVVVLVIDQMRDRFLDDFSEVFGKDGFNRLLSKGIRFTDHQIPYSNTETAPGHAGILSGLYPKHHGIIKNYWYEEGNEKRIYCVRGTDSDSVFTNPGKYFAPHNFHAETVGDLLRKKYPRAGVFTVSGKDRSAILLGGKNPSAAYWMDKKNYNMVTSAYYLPRLPSWVQNWNKENRIDTNFQSDWDYLLQKEAYAGAPMASANPHLVDPLWQGPLPHRINYSMMGQSHYQAERSLSFIKKLIQHESLGKDEVPDLLAWSISYTDHIGHIYGMESHEVLDAYARTDRLLAELFRHLDSLVGPDQYNIFLTSDHGVRHTVPHAVKNGNTRAMSLDKSAITRKFVSELRKDYVISEDSVLNYNYRLVRIRGNNIYFNRPLIDSLSLPFETIRQKFADFIVQIPGVTQIIDLQQPFAQDPFSKSAALNFYPSRSGDFMINIDTSSNFKLILGMHGYYGRDCQHIPLLAFIPGRQSRQIPRTTFFEDLAPTLANLLNLKFNQSVDGKLLHELF